MSDLAPASVKPVQATNKNQLIVLAALGVVLLLALVFFVLKPFGGDDDAESSSSSNQGTTANATDPAASPQTGDALVQDVGAMIKTLRVDSENFAAVTPDALAQFGESYTFVSGPSTGPNVISVSSTPNAAAAAVLLPSGECHGLVVSDADTVTRVITGSCDAASVTAGAPAPAAPARNRNPFDPPR